MSRYVFFYKLNSSEGKETLFHYLTSKIKSKISFKDFIADRRLECGKSFTTTYDQIIKSVLANFNEILPSELREIVNWYEQVAITILGENDSWKEYDNLAMTMLKNSGIELIFEITSSSTSCYAFIFQYGTFSDHYDLDAFDEKDDEGSNFKSHEFIRFVEYMVLLLCKINESGLDGPAFDYENKYSNNAQHVIERIKLTYKDDDKLNVLIEDEFANIKKHWLEHLENRKGDNHARISPEAHTVYDTYNFLISCLEMLESIKEENQNVVMIHS